MCVCVGERQKFMTLCGKLDFQAITCDQTQPQPRVSHFFLHFLILFLFVVSLFESASQLQCAS